jgi:hypothetical protein
MIGKRPKTLAMLSVSQVSGFAGAISCNGLLCKRVELAGMRVTFDGRIESIGVKRFKPGSKSRQFSRRELFDGLFNVFGCCHSGNITPRKRSEKPSEGSSKPN